MSDGPAAMPDGESGRIVAFGTAFSPVDTRMALDLILQRPPGAPFAYVCTPNAVHVVNYARGEPRFVTGIDGAWLRLSDSRVVARLAAASTGVRLPLALGSDLTALLAREEAVARGPVCVIGGTAEMERRLRERFGWSDLARYEPPMGFAADPAELDRCADFVVANPARFVFLACGAPQSELLGAHIVRRGGAVGTGLCIGASLLFVTGLEIRAPLLMQRAGLEWLHRLVREPRRMSRRLVQGQLPLLLLAARHGLRRR